MKTEELLINGVRVDMSPDTRIVLNFKSNLLGDISKITASNSQTISLPKTTRNRELFDHATRPSYNSRFRYRRHRAEYYRNGVKIISDGYAVLLDSAENYEIALYWGEMTKFQSWLDMGLSIKDLDFSNIYQIWRNPVTLAACYNGNTEGDYYFPDDSYLYYVDYDCGVGSVETMSDAAKALISLHPVMSARKILQKIQSENGITFEFPAGFMDSAPGQHVRAGIFQGLAIPMLTRKTSEQTSASATVTGTHEKKNSMDRYVGINLTLPTSSHYTTEQKSYNLFFGGSVEATSIVFQTEGHVKFSILLSVQTAEHGRWNRAHPGTPTLELGMNDGNTRMVACRCTQTKIGDSTGWSYFMTTLTYTYEADVVSGDSVALLVRVHNSTEFYKYYSNYESYLYPYFLTLYPPAVEVDIQLGQYFRVNGNLPDIKQIDFVKALCAMYGLFVVPSGTADKLKFVSLDDLFANKANAIDWSSRLIRTYEDEPERVKFTLGDYARRNLFDYAEDDSVVTSGAGEIDIDNETLEPKKDIIKLPFAASDETIVDPDNEIFGEITGARIPLYEWDTNGTEVKMNNPKPRILQIVSDGTPDHSGDKAIGRFIPITFNRLIEKYYNNLTKTLNNAVTITEKIRLTEYELLNLDFTKPVFLKQYGRYYGVVSVQTGDEYCTVELLQFPETSTGLPDLLFSTDNGATWTGEYANEWTGKLLIRTAPGNTLKASDVVSICAAAAESGLARRADFSASVFQSDKFVDACVQVDADNDVWSLDNIWYFHVPSNVKTIGRKAFYFGRNMYQIFLPDGLEVIERQALEYCYNIRILDIPAGVTSIGDAAIAYAQKLGTIYCRAATPPVCASNAFYSAGTDVGGTHRLYVPAGSEALYAAATGWSSLINDYGFIITTIQ